MEDLKQANDIISENEISLQRRANMMGQHLANTGFENVKVTIEVKVVLSNDTGQHTRTISGEYSKYVAGNGPANIGGGGAAAPNRPVLLLQAGSTENPAPGTTLPD